MKRALKELTKSAMKGLGIGITNYENLQKLRESEIAAHDIEFLSTLPHSLAPQLLPLLKKSRSQLRQDLFVLAELGFKRNGFFVEFGATNGVDLSNTYLLEKDFAWSGILAEPARCWHKNLAANRTASIETDCVWSNSTSTLQFNEVAEAEFSTITSFNDNDSHVNIRKSGKSYDVKTISLQDMLAKYQAPHYIDYLSIDTEGSEFEILNNFDFNLYKFGVITCEHNYTPMRESIHKLLSSHGYERKYQTISKFDDWYVYSSSKTSSK